MKARYDGHCVWCALPISAGESIRHIGDRWIHETCKRYHQADPVDDVGTCDYCDRDNLLLTGGMDKHRYCSECNRDLAERLQEDYGHIHDIYDMPF